MKNCKSFNKNGPMLNINDLMKDKILLDQAIEFIKENPTKYILLYFKKFFSFYVFRY